ncbi:MAG TPA: ABC transporter permease, partial [Pseudacidobacterium sp.]|nr:ABC transporter permease [Pseudacidobacterium sp.]
MRLKRFFRKAERDAELATELEVHVAHEMDDNLARGMNEEEARRQAYLKFGNPTRVREEIWRMNSFVWLENLLRDARYSLRQLRKSPGFTLLCVLTLTLSIGASTAVFTFLDCIVLKPLAYQDSSRLVVAWERVKFLSSDPTGPNPRHVDLWQKRSTAFSGLTLLIYGSRGLSTGVDEHPQLVGSVVSYTNLFDVLQVQPFLGRTFRPEDGISGHDKVVILTYSLWQTVFHGDRNAIGKVIQLADAPCEIIGVLPADFHFPDANALPSFHSNQSINNVQEPAVFLPAVVDLNRMEWGGNFGNWIALGRLKPGVNLRFAKAQLNAIQNQVFREMPADQRPRDPDAFSASLQPIQEVIVSRYKAGIWLLMAVVAGFMLIACLNLANAQLGRALSRNREAAVRSALGATRWRLLSISLMESLLLGLAGGTAGVLLAVISLKFFRLHNPLDIPRLTEVQINWAVMLFALALTVGSSLLFGIIPALRFWHVDPQASLQENSSATAGSGRTNRIRAWLIGLEICGCTALLLLTGVFSKSLLFLLHQDKGFETGHVAVAQVRLSQKNYGTDKSLIAFDDAVLTNLRAIPGVQSAALVSAMPLEGESWIEWIQRTDRLNQNNPLFNFRWVSPGYFETLHEKLLA